MRAALIANFSPVIEALSRHTRLGRAAMWATAADNCAYALLRLGRLLGDELASVEEISTFAQEPSPLSLHNDLIPIEHIGRRHHMVNRNSCCLYYRTENGHFCQACPHRPLEERIDLFRQRIEREQASAS